MIVRIGILRKKEGLSSEDFRKYWTEMHGPIVARLPGLRIYHQNQVVDPSLHGLDLPRSSQAVDGFSELWFDDLGSMNRSLYPENIKMLAEDEAHFVENLQLIVAKQNVVIQTASDKPLIKRMTLFRRRADVDYETFKHEWMEEHPKHVRCMPGIEGYTQNLVIERYIEPDKAATYESMPIDGVTELWFKDIPSLEAAFASPNGQTTMSHSRTFIESTTTFIVETHRIILTEHAG